MEGHHNPYLVNTTPPDREGVPPVAVLVLCAFFLALGWGMSLIVASSPVGVSQEVDR